MAGKIIILSGASSSGKSSIAKALQSRLEEDYFLTGIDYFLQSMPLGFVYVEKTKPSNRSNYGIIFNWENGEVQEIQISDKGYAFLNAMYASIANLAANNVNVIIDDVIFNSKIHKLCLEHLSKYDPTVVGIYCIAEVRYQREIARKDRMSGLYKVHEKFIYQQMQYDFVVDNTVDTVAQSVSNLLKKLNV